MPGAHGRLAGLNMRTLPSRRPASGFTLLEVIFVVVLLGIMTKFAMMKLVTPGTLTLPAQAQSVADIVRRAQSLAVVRGQRVRVYVATSGVNGRIEVECLPVSSPCATGTLLPLTLAQGVSLGAGSVVFNTLGVPLNSTTLNPLTNDFPLTVVSYTTGSFTVVVAALTGRVTVN